MVCKGSVPIAYNSFINSNFFSGTPLMPKEMVTPQVIANWFANKRKEMRRKSHDEPLSATICGAAQQFVDAVSQSSPVNNSSVFSSSMNQLVAVANAAAALAHAAANNNNNQQQINQVCLKAQFKKDYFKKCYTKKVRISAQRKIRYT